MIYLRVEEIPFPMTCLRVDEIPFPMTCLWLEERPFPMTDEVTFLEWQEYLGKNCGLSGDSETYMLSCIEERPFPMTDEVTFSHTDPFYKCYPYRPLQHNPLILTTVHWIFQWERNRSMFHDWGRPFPPWGR